MNIEKNYVYIEEIIKGAISSVRKNIYHFLFFIFVFIDDIHVSINYNMEKQLHDAIMKRRGHLLVFEVTGTNIYLLNDAYLRTDTFIMMFKL